MNWRTDKPTADVIVAKLKYGGYEILYKYDLGYCFLDHEDKGEEYDVPMGDIVKWADLEEDEPVTDCNELKKAAEEYAKDETMAGLAERAFKAGANWQREQFHDACHQCEKAYDNVFFRGEQHAIKMLKEEAIEGKCVNVGNAGAVIDTDYGCLFLPPESFKVDDVVKIYIFKDE